MTFDRPDRLNLASCAALAAVGALWIIGGSYGYRGSYAVVAAAVVTLYLLRLFVVAPGTLFAMFGVLAMILTAIPSNVYLEFGNYISEEGVYGSVTGATIRLCFLTVTYIWAMSFAIGRPPRVPWHAEEECGPSIATRFMKMSALFHVGALVASAAVLAVYGSPFLTGEDRFSYWARLPGVLNRLPFLLTIAIVLSVVAICVVPQASGRAIKRGGALQITLIACSVIVFWLFSDKFTSLYSAVTFSIGATYVVRIDRFKRRPRFRRLFLGSLLALLALLSIAAYGYTVLYGYTSSNVVAKVTDRALGLQGHVWFGIDRNAQLATPRGPLWELYAPSTFDRPTGLDALMYQVAPKAYVDIMRSRGERFTLGSPAIAVYTLGYAGALAYQVVAGIATGLVVRYLRRGIRVLSVARIVVAMIGVRVMTDAFVMGGLANVYKPLALVFYCWVLGDVAAGLLKRQRSRRVSGEDGRSVTERPRGVDHARALTTDR